MNKDKNQIRQALAMALYLCGGYDLDTLMESKTRTRILADLRAIVWLIYGEATESTSHQIAQDFGRNRMTVHSALERASSLRAIDRDFKSLYDSVFSAYEHALAKPEQGLDNKYATISNMAKFKFNAKPIGISCVYDKDDPRLIKKVDIHIAYAGSGLAKNKVLHKTVSVTEAEKAVIESIAMRLFLDHKKLITQEETDKGKIKVTGVIAVDVMEK